MQEQANIMTLCIFLGEIASPFLKKKKKITIQREKAQNDSQEARPGSSKTPTHLAWSADSTW